ncbi:hypothetical protein yrohd0001_3160 [Yersinia rohdei ATCC 43380]|nr:hypothetical protein yrohd0001_3160 [Yersinia rohdei ATCC 43380]
MNHWFWPAETSRHPQPVYNLGFRALTSPLGVRSALCGGLYLLIESWAPKRI